MQHTKTHKTTPFTDCFLEQEEETPRHFVQDWTKHRSNLIWLRTAVRLLDHTLFNENVLIADIN